MDNLSGRWTGEYGINFGTEDEPDIRYFHFKTKISDVDSVITGDFIDLTLKTTDSKIQGFTEEDFINFIRISEQSPELLEFLNIEMENSEKPLEFNFSGNYDPNEEAYVGVWDIELDEISNGFQDSYTAVSVSGAWYMRKM